jgi:hypothetical protein
MEDAKAQDKKVQGHDVENQHHFDYEASSIGKGDILQLEHTDPVLNAKMHLVNNAIDEIGFTSTTAQDLLTATRIPMETVRPEWFRLRSRFPNPPHPVDHLRPSRPRVLARLPQWPHHCRLRGHACRRALLGSDG